MITRPKIWIAVSTLTIIVSLALILIVQPNWGIDFVGGSLLEIKSSRLQQSDIADTLTPTLPGGVTVQSAAPSFLIRTTPLDQAKYESVLSLLTTKDPDLEVLRFESIGPTIGAELRRKAWMAVTASLVVMIVYLAYEFRHTGGLIRPWKYGVAAAIALAHDILFVTAVFVVFGTFYGVPVDSLFLTALLALLGYSVNDTIVIFNRLKQEWLATQRGDLVTIMDQAAKVTLIRSLNTSLTILLALIALLMFGGPTIYWFIVALTLGTIVGTYSSIFVAAPFLYALARK